MCCLNIIHVKITFSIKDYPGSVLTGKTFVIIDIMISKSLHEIAGITCVEDFIFKRIQDIYGKTIQIHKNSY